MKFYPRHLATATCLIGLATLPTAAIQAETTAIGFTAKATAKRSKSAKEPNSELQHAIADLETVRDQLLLGGARFSEDPSDALVACDDAILKLRHALEKEDA